LEYKGEEKCLNEYCTLTIYKAVHSQFTVIAPSFTTGKKHVYIFQGLHGGVVVSTVASHEEGSRLNSRLRPFGVEFACSPRVCVGSLRVPASSHCPKTCMLG